MKKIVFSVAVSLGLFVFLTLLGIAAPPPTQSSFEIMQQPIGRYEISVLKNGRWRQAGILRFNKFLQEKEIDLDRFLPEKGEIRLRLIQEGGGAAHIDAVSCGGARPSAVNGSDDKLALQKLLKRDFDVLDAFN